LGKDSRVALIGQSGFFCFKGQVGNDSGPNKPNSDGAAIFLKYQINLGLE
jgi:hypothetical protein